MHCSSSFKVMLQNKIRLFFRGMVISRAGVESTCLIFSLASKAEVTFRKSRAASVKDMQEKGRQKSRKFWIHRNRPHPKDASGENFAVTHSSWPLCTCSPIFPSLLGFFLMKIALYYICANIIVMEGSLICQSAAFLGGGKTCSVGIPEIPLKHR